MPEQSRAKYEAAAMVIAVAEQRRFDEAADLAARLIQEHGDRGLGLLLLGIVAWRLTDPGRALDLLEAAHKASPDSREIVDALACLMARVGLVRDSLFYGKLGAILPAEPALAELLPSEFGNYRAALDELAPPRFLPIAYNSLSQRRYRQAIDLAQRQLRLTERDPEVYRLLGQAHAGCGEWDVAVDAFRAADHLDPGEPVTKAMMAEALMQVGRPDEARALLAEALRLGAGDPAAMAWGVLLAPALGLDFAEAMAACRASLPAMGDRAEPSRPEGRPLRLGILGNRFHTGPEAAWVEAYLLHRDRNAVEVYGYQQSVGEDDATVRLKALSERWREVYDIDDETLAVILRGDGIDVLIDTCGFTPDNRLALLAQHPVPLQLGWLNWRAEALPDFMDGALAGRAVPAVSAAGLEVAVGPAPVAASGHVTFGAVLSPAAMTAPTLSAWARLLDAVPSSRLLLGGVPALSDQARHDVEALLDQAGIGARVSLQPVREGEDSLRGLIAGVDALLDRGPVAQTWAVVCALAAGVAVVGGGIGACGVDTAGVLAAAGHADWAADNDEDFIGTAARVAADLRTRPDFRAAIAAEVAASPLADGRGFAARLEAALYAFLPPRA